MANRFRFDVDIDHWVNGAAGFEVAWKARAKPKIERTMARAFEIADNQVHVITGFLKSTGSYEVRDEGDSIIGEILYGADYAIYEFGRGGEHDALTPAIIEVEDEWLGSMMEPIIEVLGTWR